MPRSSSGWNNWDFEPLDASLLKRLGEDPLDAALQTRSPARGPARTRDPRPAAARDLPQLEDGQPADRRGQLDDDGLKSGGRRSTRVSSWSRLLRNFFRRC